MQQTIKILEQLCNAGIQININYYIDKIMSPTNQTELYNYFMHADTDDVHLAIQKLKKKFCEEDIRLMRIKILTQLGS